MQREDFRFFERLRVRWAEVDLQNIVFNGHYLAYWDAAISAYWRALGLPYADAMARLGGELFVRKATLEYLASASYEDSLDVGMRCARLGNSSITFACCVFRDDEALVSGELVYVYADAHARKSMPVPAVLRQALQDFESGHTLWTLQWGPDPSSGDASGASRTLLMRNRLDMTIAELRCREHAEGTATDVACELTHLQVDPGVRGQGMGTALLEAAKHEAQARGCIALWAQVPSYRVPWFTRAGFVVAPRENAPLEPKNTWVRLAIGRIQPNSAMA